MKRVAVAAAVLVGLAGWMFAVAVGEAREAARRAQCVGHLKWMAVAVHNYHSVHGTFPPGTVAHPGLPPGRRLGWVVAAWAEVGGSGTALRLDGSRGWDEPPNWPPRVVATGGMTFHGMTPEDTAGWVTCPDDPASTSPRRPLPLTYVGVAGLGADASGLPLKHPRAGVFGDDRATRIADVTDGTTHTLLFLESTRGHAPWTAGGPSSVRGVDPATRPYLGPGRPFGGYHPGGANAAFADGSVRFLRDATAPAVVDALSTAAGGEPLPPGWDHPPGPEFP